MRQLQLFDRLSCFQGMKFYVQTYDSAKESLEIFQLESQDAFSNTDGGV